MENLELLLPMVKAILNDHGALSSVVRDELCKRMSAMCSVTVSHRRTNKILSSMVDEGLLCRVARGRRQFYAVDLDATLRDTVDIPDVTEALAPP
jgi:hypothetical protein